MDQERFDQITRTLAAGQSRRRLLKGLAGTALGGVLAAVGAGEAGAKGPCKTPNTKCGRGKNAVCCSSNQVCNGDGTCGPRDMCANVYCQTHANPCMVNACNSFDGGCYPAYAAEGTECIYVDSNNFGSYSACNATGYCPQPVT